MLVPSKRTNNPCLDFDKKLNWLTNRPAEGGLIKLLKSSRFFDSSLSQSKKIWLEKLCEICVSDKALLGASVQFNSDQSSCVNDIEIAAKESKGGGIISGYKTSVKINNVGPQFEFALSKLYGFGPTQKSESELLGRNPYLENQAIIDDWFETNSLGKSWRDGTFKEFIELYELAIKNDELQFPDALLNPKSDSSVETNKLTKGGSDSSPDTPSSASEVSEKKPKPNQKPHMAYLAAFALATSAVVIAWYYWLAPPSMPGFFDKNVVQGPCIPNGSDVSVETEGKSDILIQAKCSAIGWFQTDISNSDDLAPLKISQVYNGRKLALVPNSSVENIHAGIYRMGISVSGQYLARKIIKLRPTCPSGYNIARLINKFGNERQIICDNSLSKPPIEFALTSGQSRSMKVLFNSDDGRELSCFARLIADESKPVDLAKIADCASAAQNSVNQGAILQLPLIPFWSQKDIYHDPITGLDWLKDLHRFGNFQYWKDKSDKDAFESIQLQITQDLGPEWRLATKSELLELVTSLHPAGIGSKFLGRIETDGTLLLSGLIRLKNDSCKNGGFFRFGFKGAFDDVRQEISRHHYGFPCQMNEPDLGMWIVK